VRGLEAISGFDEFRSSCSGKHIQHCPSPVGEGARRADEGFPTSRLSPNLTPRPCRVKQRPCVTFGAPQIANTWGRIDSFGAPHPTSAFSKNASPVGEGARRADEGFQTSRLSPNRTPPPRRAEQTPRVKFNTPHSRACRTGTPER